ncbi:NmrA family NAD(P)-binding protein [Flavitalea sp. BT771]|uniref:NmrA family NAD(P)-binding protein n=1 Tax=Flavitalea sp. BT771 TaxID=3063329 RepID=UPI0026E3DD7B|nr:NmrA family NAD(P)-binding protein [Flavitalea sp. BT771]MDO6430212.1 NmrA family NAD(P)-binding protein [Flavitalea sp. BT771]MDV6219649.1 NmrA family NAD(P)-binding protein [Flavitalea sp. BT771]
MHLILGATGHIGSALAKNLLQHGEPVTVIIRNEKKAIEWQQTGAKVAIADVLDTDKLKDIFKQGKKLFLLNPPAPPHTDTVMEERRTLYAILKALENSGIEKVVAESTYGAQPGDGIGDLGVLYEMEQALKTMNIPHSIIRGAYYMSNWDRSLATARKEQKIYTLYPIGFKLPMVAPKDIAKVAARLMMRPVEQRGLYYVEGPEFYSAADVADACAKALGTPVTAITTPKDQWQRTLESAGFSPKAAASMAAMTDLTLNDPFNTESPIKGTTTIEEYISDLSTPSAERPLLQARSQSLAQ